MEIFLFPYLAEEMHFVFVVHRFNGNWHTFDRDIINVEFF